MNKNSFLVIVVAKDITLYKALIDITKSCVIFEKNFVKED